MMVACPGLQVAAHDGGMPRPSGRAVRPMMAGLQVAHDGGMPRPSSRAVRPMMVACMASAFSSCGGLAPDLASPPLDVCRVLVCRSTLFHLRCS